MKLKYVVRGLIVVGLLAAGWFIAQQPVAQRAEGQGDKGDRGEKVKPGRYQVVGAGLITAVMFDTETGKTWALTPGMMDGPRGFNGPDPEFAWAPITKFDDLESYRRWVKQQMEKRMEWERERFGRDKDKEAVKDKDKDRFNDKDKKDKERLEDKEFEARDKRFEDKERDDKRHDEKKANVKDDKRL